MHDAATLSQSAAETHFVNNTCVHCKQVYFPYIADGYMPCKQTALFEFPCHIILYLSNGSEWISRLTKHLFFFGNILKCEMFALAGSLISFATNCLCKKCPVRPIFLPAEDMWTLPVKTKQRAAP